MPSSRRAKEAAESAYENGRTDVEMDESPSSLGESHGEVGASEATVQEETASSSEQVLSEATDDTAERRSKRPRTASAEKPSRTTRTPALSQSDMCQACGCNNGLEAQPLLTCMSCDTAFHANCYSRDDSIADPTAWTCDECEHKETRGAGGSPRVCVYCTQSEGTSMRIIDTAHWPESYRRGNFTGPAWGHVDCAYWDPFLEERKGLAVADPVEPTEGSISPDEPVVRVEAMRAANLKPVSSEARSRLELLVAACSFCGTSDGVRIQCRHLHCAKFFHVKCARESDRGCVDVSLTPFPRKHAYCNRHYLAQHDLSGLATKLTSKTMASLLPRDTAAKIQGVARRIDTFATLDALVTDLAEILVDVCKKGFKSSKSDPPTFSMRHLQALQLVLDYLPQLRRVYESRTLSKSDSGFVADPEVWHALQRAFQPQRFVRKFAGPLSQFHECDVCHEPFQERHHVFYCTSSEQVHALHWKCTKRKSNAKESRQGGSAKKKLKSVALVQQGHWKDVKLPKGLPSVSDGIACGVCRAPVDARGILASRKETTRVEFERPSSEFMFGGCFANEMDARSAAAAGLRTSRATTVGLMTATTTTAMSAARSSGKGALRRSGSGVGAVIDLDGDATAILGPPKMERINVRRTTRWLACLGEVIRLVLAAKKEAPIASAATSDAAKEDNSTAGVAKANSSVEAGISENGVDKEVAAVVEEAVAVIVAAAQRAAHTTTNEKPAHNGTLSSGVSGEVESTLAPSAETEGGAALNTVKQEVDGESDPKGAGASTGGEIDVAVAQEAHKPEASSSLLPPLALAYLEEAKNVVRPFDAYALDKMESAHRMLENRSGPGLSVLSTLIQEYTRFMYIKHTRAVEKATNEKRKRQEQEALEERERERKRIDREAEQALKKQMLAMRKKQRQ